MIRPVFFFAALGLILFSGCYYDTENELYFDSIACDSVAGTYLSEVKPIIDRNCISCHNSASPSAGIVLDNHTGLSANATRALASMNHEAGVSQMPKGSPKLSDCDIKKVRVWIDKGKPNN
jgi:mono/diheme cytochrome c family protein